MAARNRQVGLDHMTVVPENYEPESSVERDRDDEMDENGVQR